MPGPSLLHMEPRPGGGRAGRLGRLEQLAARRCFSLPRPRGPREAGQESRKPRARRRQRPEKSPAATTQGPVTSGVARRTSRPVRSYPFSPPDEATRRGRALCPEPRAEANSSVLAPAQCPAKPSLPFPQPAGRGRDSRAGFAPSSQQPLLLQSAACTFAHVGLTASAGFACARDLSVPGLWSKSRERLRVGCGSGGEPWSNERLRPTLVQDNISPPAAEMRAMGVALTVPGGKQLQQLRQSGSKELELASISTWSSSVVSHQVLTKPNPA
ncbi:uncharacterized protein LOC120593434 [Pteropus medius]|uniref:uncharacterized protein LOC120593434 n=1 Tax=Pteropus vampyrus TaxID=132908 RepID=UPI00196B337F|nr:uncharacterized protein LOC120593434 [Pteropus giganteus]